MSPPLEDDPAPAAAVSRPRTVALRDALRELIAAEGLVPGDRLPSEVELAERYSVGRGSVRVALKLLESDGVIDVRHGRGNFVSALGGVSVSSAVTKFESVTEMLEARGLKLTTRVLSVERALPTAEEAEALQIEPQHDVIRVRRLRLGDGELLVFSANVFAAELLGELDPHQIGFSDSLTSWLVSIGRGPVSSAAHMRTAQLPPDVAARPEVRPGTTWLLISELCVDHAGIPVLLSEDYHRGDVFSFHVLRRRGT
jgi:GntR family transcriptional regulator